MNPLRAMLVDVKNGLPPRWLADRVHPRGLVYVHVPKCAGTSAERALRAHFRLSRIDIGAESSFRAAQASLGLNADNDTRHKILMRASEMRRDLLHYNLSLGYKCITGHAPLGPETVTRWQPSHDFITLLREPVARYLSHLTYNISGGGGHGAINEPLDAFLQRPRARIMGALYPKYFSGLAMDDDLSSVSAIDAAKEQLEQHAVVGFLENMEQFTTELATLTGSSIRMPHRNATTSDQKQALSLTDAQHALIEEYCAPDIEIYRWAKERFG